MERLLSEERLLSFSLDQLEEITESFILSFYFILDRNKEYTSESWIEKVLSIYSDETRVRLEASCFYLKYKDNTFLINNQGHIHIK